MPSAGQLKIDEETVTHTWVIKNLSNYVGHLTSPTFFMFGDYKQKFQLNLKVASSGRLLILRCMEKEALPTSCLYNISVVANDRRLETRTGHHAFNKFRSEKEIFNFNSADLDRYQTEGSLTFACQLFDRERLFFDENSSDVLLRTASGEELPAHRCLLALVSPTFKAMLEQEMVDNLPRTTHTIDVDDHVAAVEMLRFIYLCKISADCDVNLIGKIFQAAERYQLEGLRNLCEEKLICALSPANVMGILKWADTNKATLLKKAAVHLILSQLSGPNSVDEKCEILLGKYVPKVIVKNISS